MARQLARSALAIALLAGGAAPAFAIDQASQCANGVCTLRLTAAQLLARAEQLVSEHRFDEAAPMLAALENAPQFAMERNFLLGYSAIETGKTDAAIKYFRRALVNHPEQTRIRLELARALMLSGNALAADHHYRLAEQDKRLPEEIDQTIRSARGILHSQRQWSFNVNFGLAPDSNITNGTNAQTIDVSLGAFTVPVTLSQSARAHSGTGQFLTGGGSARLGLIGETRLLIDGDASFTNYKGGDFDDLTAQLAAGPEVDLDPKTTIAVQALGAQRWFSGQRALSAGGMRTVLQHELAGGQRLGLSADVRYTDSGFTNAYSGWQYGGYATYERVVAHRMIASASLFARRDALEASAYSSTELGANLGIGGELPHGISAGLSAGISHTEFDSALAYLSPAPRTDWRYNARVHVGLRSIRVLGFSPSVTYSFAKSQSSLTLYDSERHRVNLGLARYF